MARGAQGPKYKKEQIATALRFTYGRKSEAAAGLGVTPETMSNYMKRFPELHKVVDEAREAGIDYAESKLFEMIKEKVPAAVIFYLKTQAKTRGYVEDHHFEHTGANGAPLVPKQTVNINVINYQQFATAFAAVSGRVEESFEITEGSGDSIGMGDPSGNGHPEQFHPEGS